MSGSIAQVLESLDELLEAGPTFAVAKIKVLDRLSKIGWATSEPRLKVPHATSRDGRTRLYFKPQAIYMDHGGRGINFTLNSARSYSSMMKELSAAPDDEFRKWADVAGSGTNTREAPLSPVPKGKQRAARKPRQSANTATTLSLPAARKPAAQAKPDPVVAQPDAVPAKVYSAMGSAVSRSAVAHADKLVQAMANANREMGSHKLVLERVIDHVDLGTLKALELRIANLAKAGQLLNRAAAATTQKLTTQVDAAKRKYIAGVMKAQKAS